MKIKSRYFIERSKYPSTEGTHVLWYESQTLGGSGYRGIYKGTYQECLIEKEKRDKNVSKSKKYSFSLLRKVLHDK